MKLDAEQVQQIRSLFDVGFSTASIASVYGVTGRQAWDIVRGRAWKFLPPMTTELPVFTRDSTERLKFSSAKRLTPEQKAVLCEYINRSAASIEREPERQAYAASLMRTWTHRRPRQRSTRKAVAQ